MLKILELMQQHQYDYSDIRPYVFSQSDGDTTPIPYTEEVIASPFEKFSIEVDAGYLTVDNGPNAVNIECIYCHELSFDSYFFIVGTVIRGEKVIYHVNDSEMIAYRGNTKIGAQATTEMYIQMKNIVSAFLGKLHKGRLGLFNTGSKAKFKTKGGLKKVFKATDIIYVRAKGEKESVANKTNASRSVNWKNTWEVSSHWRRLDSDSLGLSREGKRTVKGATWIKSYNKGMGELKTKVRRVI